MAIELELVIDAFKRNTSVISGLCAGVPAEQARWRPSDDAWSLLEVIGHLHDEEREDFRTRVDLTLHQPRNEWPPIDPAGWVTARAYNAQTLPQMLNAWLAERETSLAWLRALKAPNWDSTHSNPQGSMRAGDVLAAWLAHDYLHIRQLNELRYLWHARAAQPYSVQYAGDW